MSDPAQDTLRKAFARRFKQADERGAALPPDELVMALLEDAWATLKTLPNQYGGRLFAKSFWPEVAHDYGDEIRTYHAMFTRLALEAELRAGLEGRRSPLCGRLRRMEAVFVVYPRCLTGRDRLRDWQILCLLAEGLPLRRVAQEVRSNKDTVAQRRDLQLAHIASELAELMPRPSCGVKN